MSQEGWPDAGDFPYIAMIRIRYAHEFDLEVLQIVQRAVTRSLPPDLAAQVTKTITAVAARVAMVGIEAPVPVEKAVSHSGVSTFRAMYFDGELCPPWWRGPWPRPPRLEEWLRFGPLPDPWHRFGPAPDLSHDVSPVAGVRVLVSARAALGALTDRGVAEQIGGAIDATLHQLAG